MVNFIYGTGPIIRARSSSDDVVVTSTPKPFVVSTGSVTDTTQQDVTLQTTVTATTNSNFTITTNLPVSIPVTYTSQNTAVATVDIGGNVKWVSNGTAEILVSAPGYYPRLISQTISQSGAQAATIFTGYIAGSLGSSASSAIDSAISGLTAGQTTPSGNNWGNQSLYSSGYTRNTGIWLPGVDLTCMNYRTNSPDPGVTVITPKHVLGAVHYGFGFPFWIDNNGVTYRPTIVNSQPISGTDILIGELSTALPSAITPAKFLPSNYLTYLPNIGTYPLPIIFTDQFDHLKIGEALIQNKLLVLSLPTRIPAREPWYSTPISGDSGSAVGVVVGGQFCLLDAFHWSNGGDDDTDYLAAIQTAINSLGGGYNINSVSLAAFTVF